MLLKQGWGLPLLAFVFKNAGGCQWLLAFLLKNGATIACFKNKAGGCHCLLLKNKAGGCQSLLFVWKRMLGAAIACFKKPGWGLPLLACFFKNTGAAIACFLIGKEGWGLPVLAFCLGRKVGGCHCLLV